MRASRGYERHSAMDEYSAPLREEGDRPVVTFGVGRYSGRQELTGRRSQWSGTAL